MQNTDDLARLGVDAAHRTVDLMPNSTWPAFRDELARFFADFPDGAGLATVDLGREQLVAAAEDEVDVLRRAVTRSIAGRFTEALGHHPQAVERLRSLLAGYADTAARQDGFTVATQKARASGGSQIFQAGGSQTIHVSGPGGRDGR